MAENFVNLCGFCPAAKGITKLCFDHVKGGLDVAALMVLLHKPRLVVAVIVIHPTPKRALLFILLFGPVPAFPKDPTQMRCST